VEAVAELALVWADVPASLAHAVLAVSHELRGPHAGVALFPRAAGIATRGRDDLGGSTKVCCGHGDGRLVLVRRGDDAEAALA
jgi:hypothetical protein